MESTIRRPTVSRLQWYPKCSKCWSMPASTCIQATWPSLWPTQTRSRNYVKVMVVGVMCGITSSALTWLTWEGSIRWVLDHGEHHAMTRWPVLSQIGDTRSQRPWCSHTARDQTKYPLGVLWMLNCCVTGYIYIKSEPDILESYWNIFPAKHVIVIFQVAYQLLIQ